MNNLIWNVYYHNSNAKRIELYNIFEHYGFMQALKKNYKENKDDKKAFLEQLKSNLSYFFWAKYEWEITLWNWTPKEDFKYEKIDVYDQVNNNWHVFSEYVWNNKELIRKLR